MMGTAQSAQDGEEAPGNDHPGPGNGGTPLDSSKLPVEVTSRYEVLDKIGTGSYGAVYKVRDKKTRTIYAAKHVECKENTASEVDIQAKVDDPHVVKIYDTLMLPSVKKMVIIMEYCEGGNLLEWIKRCRRHQLLDETTILNVFREICTAVYNCHQHKIVHRDIKPENILMDYNRKIKLADFGVARILHHKSVAQSFCGTPPYMAPELFLTYLGQGNQGQRGDIGYDAKCDVWSLGCILWDMANSSNKFIHELSNTVGLNVAQTSESVGVGEVQDLVDKDIPAEYTLTKRLLHGMLKKRAEDRMTLSDVLQDRELTERLANPRDGHWSDVL